MKAAGGVCAGLLSMLDADGVMSRSHGLSGGILTGQAEAMGLPLYPVCVDTEGYAQAFERTLERFRGMGVDDGVFGDIDLQAHRTWIEERCARAGVRAHFPLWGEVRRDAARAFVAGGYNAMVVAVSREGLDPSFLGRSFDPVFMDELEHLGRDISGEDGGFHTLVLDGPLFLHPLVVRIIGQREREGLVALDLERDLVVSPGGEGVL